MAFPSNHVFVDNSTDISIADDDSVEQVAALEGSEKEDFERLVDLLNIDDNDDRNLDAGIHAAAATASHLPVPNTAITQRLLGQLPHDYRTPRSPPLRGIDGSSGAVSPLVLPPAGQTGRGTPNLASDTRPPDIRIAPERGTEVCLYALLHLISLCFT